MAEPAPIAETAALIGDRARAVMLATLMDGRPQTATDLAAQAGITQGTASSHLAKLVGGQLLTMTRQGRHRYFRIANDQVARLLEQLMIVSSDGPPRHRPRSRADLALREARTCYDHVAGRLGVDISDAMCRRGQLHLSPEAAELTSSGQAFLSALGVDIAAVASRRRVFCRPCLDWTERRPHLAGAVGAMLAKQLFERHWIERIPDSRALTVTSAGRAGLLKELDVAW